MTGNGWTRQGGIDRGPIAREGGGGKSFCCRAERGGFWHRNRKLRKLVAWRGGKNGAQYETGAISGHRGEGNALIAGIHALGEEEKRSQKIIRKNFRQVQKMGHQGVESWEGGGEGDMPAKGKKMVVQKEGGVKWGEKRVCTHGQTRLRKRRTN